MKEGGEMPWIYIFAFAIYFLNDAKDRYFLILISSIIEEIYTNANIEIQGIKPVSSRGWSPFCSLTTYSLNGESSEEPLVRSAPQCTGVSLAE